MGGNTLLFRGGVRQRVPFLMFFVCLCGGRTCMDRKGVKSLFFLNGCGKRGNTLLRVGERVEKGGGGEETRDLEWKIFGMGR